MNSTYQMGFRAEADQVLGELATSLLELGSAPHDMAAVGRVFRATNFLNKGGEMFGFEAVAAFAGEIGSVFDLARNGRLPITAELTKLTLMAGDRIRLMLGNTGDIDDASAALMEQFRSLHMQPDR